MTKIDPAAILARHEAAPRYTSYPTAPHFVAGRGEEILSDLLGGVGTDGPLSIYAHIPFCDRLCWFCGCHTKHTNRYAPVAAYVDHLVAELDLLKARLPRRPSLSRLHLGGGSPSLLHHDDLARIRVALVDAFAIAGGAEISIEIDPSDQNANTLAGYRTLGVTRASIGVQDFDPAVQAAINRPQSFEETRDVIRALRSIGVASVNIDALYGLPLQTTDTIASTIEKVLELAPDRVALFGYAHVPWVKKHQQLIAANALPNPLQRFEQAQKAETMLVGAGYVRIGIDHFALPGDELAQAAGAGHLKRNFQGYTTDQCARLVGIGASAIHAYEGGFVQNIVATGQYQATVAEGRLPAARGCRRSLDDRIRGHVIERLMCDFSFSEDDLLDRFGIAADAVIAEARAHASQDRDGLCAMSEGRFHVPPEARAFTRIVASRFDAYLQQSQFRYSRAV